MFWCLRQSGKCEWIGGSLRGFVDHYNSVNKTHYALDRCLDIEVRGEAVPEILLRGVDGERPIVIEKKIEQL